MNKVLCPKCNKPIHIKDLGAVSKAGFWHSKCLAQVYKEGKKPEDYFQAKAVSQNRPSSTGGTK
jgi:hypothetical protein